MDQTDQNEPEDEVAAKAVETPAAKDQPHKQASQKKKPSLSVRVTGGVFRLISKLLLIAFFIAIGLFIGGFLKFSTTVVDLKSNPALEKSDAIAVLTGGSQRITQALRLLQQSKGARLLISGVNPATPVNDLRKTYVEFENQFECCVDMESIAADTVGNARETAKWVKTNDYQSLIIVTSGYHMPRAILEFRRQLPEITLRSYPVTLEALRGKDWWRKPENLHLLLSEYVKYLGASVRGLSPTFTMM